VRTRWPAPDLSVILNPLGVQALINAQLEVPVAPLEETPSWSVQDAEELYHVNAWGDGYFFVNDEGHVAVCPSQDRTQAVDVYQVVQDLRQGSLAPPMLIRFQNILHARVIQLNEAFIQAIDEFGYGNRYNGVYPIKVNQLHEVVEEVLDAGRPYGLGLECGSKAELVAALAHLGSDETLLICNGYKDGEMLGLILMGQQLGKTVIPVMEKYDEFERLLRLAEEMQVQPRLGVRVKLSTNGVGRWAASSGDHSKFGLSIPELLRLVERLDAAGMHESLELLHFHLGSQVADIQTLKRAVKEITQVYAQLHQRGVPVRYLDVGGGLGVNYESGYSGRDDGINYTLAEYANSVVYAVKEVCDAEDVPPPVIVSESGRALTAHHSVLVVEVLAGYRKGEVTSTFIPAADDHAVVQELYDAFRRVREADGPSTPVSALLEAYHDAVEKRQQAHALFTLGYLPIEQKAHVEDLYWSIIRGIHEQVAQSDADYVPSELRALDSQLVDHYLCDFSVFQSILDHWAIGQRFPIMPLRRLDEAPTRRAVLMDLTCDSDGLVRRYISPNDEKHYLEVHPLREGEPYYLCFFLMGAYQDIMGDMHNLFGRVAEVHVYTDPEEPAGYYIEKMIPGATVQEMLAQVQYFPNDLHRRMQQIIRQKVEGGVMRPKAGVELLDRYNKAFAQGTYLDALAS